MGLNYSLYPQLGFITFKFQNMEKIFMALKELNMKLDNICTQTKEYLSLKEAAEFLKISKSTLYKHTSAGEIPFYRPNGKIIVFKKADLINWLERNKIDNIKTLSHETK